MTFKGLGPGKLSSKLFQDFLQFDPLRGRPSVLADFTPPVGEGPILVPLIGSCKHEYVNKTSQSVPPPLDLRPDGSSTYKLAATCKKCRIHADVFIDHSHAKSSCPANDHPLHHFQRVPSHDHTTTDRIQYAWQCSVVECRATLFIIYRLPRLDDKDVELLIHPEYLSRRYNALLQEDPGREGIREATPMEALSRIRTYVRDSLVPQHSKRQIPASNKRFQEAYGMNGEDCSGLLKRLGFKFADNIWNLPNPEPLDDRIRADGNSQRELLEDVEVELFVWMHKLATERGMVNPSATEMHSSADKDIERTLSAQSYSRYLSIRHSITSNETIPYFSSLGALPDFSDTLIEYAYNRQAACDPGLQAYYFECLQVISESRYSDQLQMKVATLQSQNNVSRRDLSAAYRFLNITGIEAKTLSDERVIERFQALQSDLSPASQEEARSHLYKISLARSSTLLLNASRQSVDTYEDALSWLGNGVTKDTPDESILAVLAFKTSDNKANEEIGVKAISTIAKARQSNLLNNFLLTGRQDGYTMGVDEALRHLNIDQNLDAVEPTILPALFESARQDRPGETTEKAIATIQQAMIANNGGATRPAPETWPVGLTSHGNTCYLNSLLQYYFSIKPLRDIVLNYDQYKLDITQNGGKKGRVGQRMISMVEIEGGQRFAAELKHLFERMIKSRDSAVKPEADLVCRAFLEPKEYKLLGPILNINKGEKASKTLANGDSAIDEKMTDGEIIASPTTVQPDERKGSNASSTTLQASVNGEVKDVNMKDAEKPPTPPSTPGREGQEKAPALPPRRFSTTKEEALAKAEANAKQQQDVTEVHDKISFLLRCGINPRSWDEKEEQEDAFRDLFGMRMTQTTVDKGKEQKPQLLPDSAIQLNVPYEPIDIYSALDAVFDLQQIEENSPIESYRSIEALPPLLQINIPRIGHDASRGSNAIFKSTECVTLKDELFLDRYSDMSHENTLPKRRQCWGWRRQLQALKREQKVLSKTPTDLDGPAAVSQTAEYLTSLDEVNADLQFLGIDPIEADGDITSALVTEAKQQAERLTSLETEINALQKQLDAQFKEMKSIKYRLAAVFFHRGSYGYGHYWIYIHDFVNDVWRQYNDETVTEFTKMESIFEAKNWDQGTPTYAVYVTEDKIDYVQAVCRDPEPEPEPAPAEEWKESGATNAPSKADSAPGIDPKLISEGGKASWDQPRGIHRRSRPCIRFGPEVRRGKTAEREFLDSLSADERLAVEMQQQMWDRSRSPSKRRKANDGGSPRKLRKMAGVEDLSGIEHLDLDGK